MKHTWPVFIVVYLLACTNGNSDNPSSPDQQIKDSVDAARKYFPVKDFLQGEVAYVDSLPVGIMKYTTQGMRTDSAYIKPAEFHQLADVFLPEELNENNFKKEFEETSFYDKSTRSSTFFYTTKNSNLSLRRVDVLTGTTDVYDKIKSVYLEKSFRSADTGIVQKLFWKPGRNFQITTQVTTAKGEPAIQTVKVVWDNRE